jgi:hypothetical protein
MGFMKAGHPDGLDGRPDGLGFHHFFSSHSPIFGATRSKASGRAANGPANGALGF